MTPQRRVGRFIVNGHPNEVEFLRAAQQGCAVMRCEYLAYADQYEVYAEHPDFDVEDRCKQVPTYSVEMMNVDGVPQRVRFTKENGDA